jgi:hypothetical membrane protein
MRRISGCTPHFTTIPIHKNIMNTIKLAGALLFLAGAIMLMGIITAETQYPTAYTTRNSEISDLGATRPPNSVSYQPSAGIFDTTILVAGVLIAIAAFFQHKHFKKLMFSIPFMLFGLGLAGVGIFPGNVSPYHGMSAMLAFLSGGVAAIMSFTIVSAPFKYNMVCRFLCHSGYRSCYRHGRRGAVGGVSDYAVGNGLWWVFDEYNDTLSCTINQLKCNYATYHSRRAIIQTHQSLSPLHVFRYVGELAHQQKCGT